MKIAIDAGHGLYTPGKRCMRAIDPKETREWQLNSRIAARVCSELGRLGFETARMDDPTGQRDVPLSERTQTANKLGCAYYISIHHDSGVNGGTGGGVTAFAYTSPSRAATKLRDTLYKHVVAETGLKGNRAQPLQTANFAVLRETKMPAALIECGFMDSKTDTPLILTADFARRAADGIVKAVCELCGKAYQVDKPKPTDDPATQAAIETIQTKAGLEQKTIEYLLAYQYGEALVKKLAKVMKKEE